MQVQITTMKYSKKTHCGFLVCFVKYFCTNFFENSELGYGRTLPPHEAFFEHYEYFLKVSRIPCRHTKHLTCQQFSYES